MTGIQRAKISYHLGVDRPTLLMFADAIFSIAITLLVLEIRLPELDPATNAALVNSLLADIPAFMAFVISFFSLASWWVQMHQLFINVHKLDRRLMWLMIVLLFFIVFTPFATYVFARYVELLVAYVFYILVYLCSGAVFYTMAAYALRHPELLAPGAEQVSISQLRRALIIYIAVTLLSIPAAALNTYYGIAILVLWNIALLAYNARSTVVKPSEEAGEGN